MSCETEFTMFIISDNVSNLNEFFNILKIRDDNFLLPCMIYIDEDTLHPKTNNGFVFDEITGEINGEFANILKRKFESYLYRNVSADSLDLICLYTNVAIEVYFKQPAYNKQGHMIINNHGEIVLNEITNVIKQ